jgi:serine protease inhibitor
LLLFLGCEAAAVTVIETHCCTSTGKKRKEPKVKEFKVDRPFEAYLVGLKKMNVLFAAKVVDPSL